MSTSIRCTRHRADLFAGVHQLDDTFKVALYQAGAGLDASMLTYGPTSEVTGGTYPAGGFAVTPQLAGDELTFVDLTVPAATVAAFQQLLLYNASRGNAAIAVITLDNPVAATGVDLVIDFPPDLFTQAA